MKIRHRIFGYLQLLVRGARLMVGVPDYQNYLRHLQQQHPGQTPMSYAEFFNERQEARYGSKDGRVGRCC